MNFIESIILGLVQGLTEFLPVSSSGHLVITQKLMGLVSEDLLVSVVAHFGTLLAIVFFYRKEFWMIFTGLFDRKSQFLVNPSLRLILLVIAATMPAAVVGLLFEDFFKSLFASTHWVGIFLLLTAVILWVSKFKKQEVAFSESFLKSLAHEMTFSQAFLIGCAQALAICPGLSRSGSTITASLFLGLKREQAAFFSFLISVPVILGALTLQLKDFSVESTVDALPLFIVFLSSLMFGLVGLFGVIAILNRGLLHLFSIYLIPLGLFVLFVL